MVPPNPFTDINSLNSIKATDARISCKLPRSNSLDSMFGHLHSFPSVESNGYDKQGMSHKFQNGRVQSLAKSTTQYDDAGSSLSLLCQHRKGSTLPGDTRQNVYDIDLKTSLPGPRFYPVDAVLKKEKLVMPLREWITYDVRETAVKIDPSNQEKYHKASTLRKVTISHAIATLLQHLALNCQVTQCSSNDLKRLCSIDNFVIRVSTEQSDPGWEVMGVDMINPKMQVQILTGVYTSCNFFDAVNEEEFTGRTITSNIISPYVGPDSTGDPEATNDEGMLCHFFGLLLHGLFAGEDLIGITPQALQKDQGTYEDGMPSPKRSSLAFFSHMRRNEFSRATSVSGPSFNNHHDRGSLQINWVLHPLSAIGYSGSLSQVVTNLVNCGFGHSCSGDSYPSLEMALVDICFLLQEPGRFLFEDFQLSPNEGRIIYSDKRSRRLYGRTAEAHLITDTFCKVASTGESEALLISGFQGCGKTRLVESIFEAIEAVDGFVVARKFEEVPTTSPISVVLSAFNELCLHFFSGSTPEEVRTIYENLVNEFGEKFHILARVLPNAVNMLSCCAPILIATNETDTSTLSDYSTLCFTLQRFMRVVSRTSRPVMLFLDDLQWADPTSLGLVHSVLSDIKGTNCMLFIGTYRDNEVRSDDIISGFLDMLSHFNVMTSKIHLNGLAESDVNSLVSDALGTLPRLSKSLSQVVFRKTYGNPYYVLEFFRSLILRDLVQFSLRERRWIWDHEKICEQNITDNVLHLLSNKLKSISESTQTALKCASCFGMAIDKTIANQLSANLKFFNLSADLDSAVEDGFIDCDGTHYRFVHDKLRIAAYELINADCKGQYHFELGMAMHSYCAIKDNIDALFATVDQINHGVPSLVIGSSYQHNVAEINYEASVKSTHQAAFTSAFNYAKVAVSLLRDDSWATQYSLSIKYYLQLGKSAFSCGCINEAKAALGKVIEGSKCLEDKIDAYFLLVAIPSLESVRTCVHVLRLLGEDLPNEDMGSCQINAAVSETKEMFERESDEALLRMANLDKSDERIENIMKFYGHLSVISWITATKMHSFYMARFAQFCLKSRIGKIGLLLLNTSELDKDEASRVYLSYYRELGLLFEPIQACVDMHNRGYELGMQVGNTSLASFHLCLAVQRKIISGINLQVLKSEIESCLKLANLHALTDLEVVMNICYTNVLTLIGEQSICPIQQVQGPRYEEIELTQEMMSSWFSGHFDRVNYLSKKWEALSNKINVKNPIEAISAAFYNGLATMKMYRTKGYKFPQPLRHISQRLLPVLAKAEECSQWNFKSKASILRAEYLSLTSKKEKAECEYEIAISSARSSKFVHEEGMACELAGMHYKHHGNMTKALDFLCQSKKCYESWGSQQKVDQMVSAIQDLLLMIPNTQCCMQDITTAPH